MKKKNVFQLYPSVRTALLGVWHAAHHHGHLLLLLLRRGHHRLLRVGPHAHPGPGTDTYTGPHTHTHTQWFAADIAAAPIGKPSQSGILYCIGWLTCSAESSRTRRVRRRSC